MQTYCPESESRSVVSDSLRSNGLYSPWNSPGQDTEVGSYSFLQGIFLTQGSNLGLLHYRRILYHLSHQRNLKPSKEGTVMNPMIPIGQVRKLRNRELEKFGQGHTELMVRQVSDPQIWVPKNKLLSASLLIFQSFFSVSF